MSKIIGIDLGTSNTAAAVMEGGKATIIPSAEGTSLGGKADESPSGASESDLRVREKELKELISRLRADRLVSQAGRDRTEKQVNGLKLCAQKLEGADPKSLRNLSDKLKAELEAAGAKVEIK